MKYLLVGLCGLVCLTSWAAGPEVRLNKNGVGLCEDRDSAQDSECYDPVSYFEKARAEKVSAEAAKKNRFTYKSVTYVFATPEHLNMFKQSPDKYLPQFGGWCAYAVAAKENKVDVDPKSFLVQDGRLLLFYDGFLADTRKYWKTDKNKTPAEYLKQADAHWPNVINKEP